MAGIAHFADNEKHLSLTFYKEIYGSHSLVDRYFLVDGTGRNPLGVALFILNFTGLIKWKQYSIIYLQNVQIVAFYQ